MHLSFRRRPSRRFLLIFINILLLFLLIIAQLPINHDRNSKDSDVVSDVDYALETFRYMHDLQHGRALIKPIVESERKVDTFSCRWRQKLPKLGTNGHWWTVEYLDLSLYSAYLDRRNNSLYPNTDASVQILAVVRRKLTSKIYCQFYSNNGIQPIGVVSGHVREIWQRGWDPRNRFYVPILITCPCTIGSSSTGYPPRFVSISHLPCTASVMLELNPIRTPVNIEDKVVVCIKGMNFEMDISTKLVEWLELQLLLGADKLLFYTYYVHPKIGKVLDHYERLGNVVQIPLSLPGDSPNQPYIRSRFIARNRQQKRRNELIPYNDCLYRHIDTHRYALIVDIDEAVVPLKHEKWTTMLAELDRQLDVKSDWTAMSVANVFKFPSLTSNFNRSIPLHMHMLRHRRRSTMLSKRGDYGKSFILTTNVATVFNHFALHRLRTSLRSTIYVDPKIALKLHYKESCPIESRNQCPNLLKNTVDDPSLDRFQAQLISRTEKTLHDLDLIETHEKVAHE